MRASQLSLKARLIISMVTIFVAVLGLVIYAQNLNTKTTEHNIKSAHVHNEFNHSLVKINSILHILEKEIYEQSITSDEDLIASINQTYDILIGELDRLKNNEILQSFIVKHAEDKNSSYLQLGTLSRKILEDVKKLKPQIKQLGHMAENYMARYPAMSVFESAVLPINQEIQLALDQSILSEGMSGLTRKESHSIAMQYQEARYAWSKHVNYVRLFIFSRFGAFGEKRASVIRNLHNRKLYFDQFKSMLMKLKIYDGHDHLDLLQSESLDTMLQLLPIYEVKFKQAKDIHVSDIWRSDMVLLDNELQPQLDAIWENIVKMEKIVSAQLNESIALSQSAANKTSILIWSSAVIIFLTFLVIYFVFEFSLRRPIANLAKALDDEARGDTNIHINITGRFTKEINHLLNAFSNMRKKVHFRQSRLESILDNAFEGIVITSEDGKIESFNNAAQELFNYSEKEITGKYISVLIEWPNIMNKNNSENILSLMGNKVDLVGIKKNSETFPVSVKFNETQIDGKRNFIASVEDISERKALMDDLEFQATHDSLTGLYNRHYFSKELETVVNQHVRGTKNQHGIVYIDLDNFKYVNDTMGHHAGDQLIIEIAELLQHRIRKTDVLSRLGGDEFAILLYHESNIQLEYVAECLRKLIGDYVFKYEGHVVDISCSIGGAYMNDNVDSKEKLLARADFACHESKRLGRNQAYVYSKKDDSQVSDMSRDIGWTRRIKDALANDKFLLACQPIYNTKEDTVSYYEVLLRMIDDDEKIIMPFGFLPAAERFGLMPEIDAWVIRNAIKLLAMQQILNPNLKFSINLSANSIDNNATYSIIKEELENNNVTPASVLFEVTETVAIANLSVATKLLSDIQALGCKTALDDFGVGYSSFAYLADLPVDIVKIDGFFVKEMESKHLNQIMVRSINDIAHALGKTTVAEFVENENVYQLLKELNVDYSQGYHLGKPVIVYDDEKSIEVDIMSAQLIQKKIGQKI